MADLPSQVSRQPSGGRITIVSFGIEIVASPRLSFYYYFIEEDRLEDVSFLRKETNQEKESMD
jgi:hypothetical protein